MDLTRADKDRIQSIEGMPWMQLMHVRSNSLEAECLQAKENAVGNSRHFLREEKHSKKHHSIGRDAIEGVVAFDVCGPQPENGP